MQPLFQTLSQLTDATGQAVSRTVGTVTAGMGSMAGAVLPTAGQDRDAPVVQSFSTDEAHKKFKEFNTDLNLKLNKLREWQGYLSTAVFWTLGSAMSILTVGGVSTNAGVVSISLAGMMTNIVPFAVVMAGVIALGTVKMVMSQHITRLQTEKGMDVSDFHLKREAELTGNEVAKSVAKLQEREAEKPLSALLSEAGSKIAQVEHQGKMVAQQPEQARLQ